MRKTRKLLFAFLLMLAAFIFVPMHVNAEVNVTIDGAAVVFDGQGPAVIDGRTLVPVREVFEALGFNVDWSQEHQAAILDYGDVTIIIYVGRDSFDFNGISLPLDVPAQIIEGRTMLPIRAILESVGHYVGWNEETNTVVIRNLWGFMSLERDEHALQNQISPPVTGEQYAVIITNMGDIHMRLFREAAPLAVENFVTHAQNGYFDGMIFHRVIEDFMIQTGDPLGTGMGGESIWGKDFGDELTPNLRHLRGAVSMANRGQATNGSQFFIVQNNSIDDPGTIQQLEMFIEMPDEDALGFYSEPTGYFVRDVWPADFMRHFIDNGGTPHLDFMHTVFGQVFYGMDVVDAIAAVNTNAMDRPVEDVIIERIEILTFGG